MKHFLLFTFFIPVVLHTQDLNLKWVKQMAGGDVRDLGAAVATDKQGNVYTVGRFGDTIDFDPGPGIFNLIRPYHTFGDYGFNDMFVCKLDAAGDFVWAKQMPGLQDYAGIEAVSMELDPSGNIYIGGMCENLVDFDPGRCEYFSSAQASFILKLDSDGNFVWQRAIGGIGYELSLDSIGNVYTIGEFHNTVDFDPGPGVFNLTSNPFNNNVFILKLDGEGNFLWVKQVMETAGSTDPYLSGTSIALDSAGNLFTTGNFKGTFDFDPGPGVYNLTAAKNNTFISKLNAEGNFVWAKQIKGNDTSITYGFHLEKINIDRFGNIIVTGGFRGTIDFDPGNSVYNLTSTFNGGVNLYISKLDNDGNFIWAKSFGIGDFAWKNSLGVYCHSMVTDISGNLYCIGRFSQTVDFDPGPGVINLSSTPSYSWGCNPVSYAMFISKFDPEGNIIWAKQTVSQAGCGTETHGNSLDLDNYGNLYISGGFITGPPMGNTTDFDPGPGTYNLSSLNGDIFIYKMDACTSSTSSTLSVTDCKSYTLNGHTYTSSGVYTQTILNSTGCDSIITLNLTISRINTTINIFACDGYTRCRTYDNCTICYTYDSSGVYTDTLVAANGCDSIVTINLITNSNKVTNAIACNSYTWHGIAYTASGIYIDTLVAANGCDSIMELHLTVNSSSVINNTVTACNNYIWNGTTYTASGFYTDTLVKASGCDSIINLHLTIVSNINTITAHPGAIEICSGSNTSFSVSAVSNQTLIYEWQVSKDGGATYFPVVNSGTYGGASTSVLTITGANADLNNNRYRCKLSNSPCNSSILSNAAILTVRNLPMLGLTASPLTSLFPWQSTTLTATPTGSGGVLTSPIWIYNNSVILGTGNTRSVIFDQVGTYQVRIQERWPSDLICSNQSDIVTITTRAGKELIIYPNPNNGQFKISYYNSDGVSDLKVVTVYDAKGARVYNARFTITGVYASLDINIITAAAGFYSVVISDDNGQRLAVGKIIVMH